MTARSLRALRGAAAAGIATFLAAVSHTIGGGGAPSAAVIIAVALLAMPVTTAVVGRRLSLWRLSAAVLLSQVAFHAAFSIVGGAAMPGSAVDATASLTHVHGAAMLPDLASGMTVAAATSPLMIAAHLVAAIASIGLLYRGEHAARALIALVIDLIVRRHVGVVPLELRVTAVPAASDFRFPSIARLSTAIRRRGPPSLSLLP